MNNSNGILIITLDFELYWGLLGKIPLENYRENVLGARAVIPGLLELFRKYQIHSTWAAVGFLFCESRHELMQILPRNRPHYVNRSICSYDHIARIGDNEQEDPYHFGLSLIKQIISEKDQEIASHTLSHYYCLEKGQNSEDFRDDLEAAIRLAGKAGLKLESLVFPKNQVNKDYLPILKEKGIKAYRGNESSWIYQGRSDEDETLLRRGLRLLDAYVNISGHNAHDKSLIKQHFPFNIPASRFLRPYSPQLARFEGRRLARILGDLSYAARNGLVYHLWWHPHNFGIYQPENLRFLQKILDHFNTLKDAYGMESLNLRDLSSRLLSEPE